MILMSDTKKHIEKLVEKADEGDSKAQFTLGYYYLEGKYVEHNFESALRLFRKAADNGNKRAQAEIGQLYYYGIGVEKNYVEAVKWFKLADDTNCLIMCYLDGVIEELNVEKIIKEWEENFYTSRSHSAMLNLAHLYSDGRLIEPDYEKAARWWEEACWGDDGVWIHGHPEAQYHMACYFYEGKGVEKNEKDALACFQGTIRTFYEQNKGCSISKEPEYIFNARRMLIKHGDKKMIGKVKRAANNGNIKAIKLLEEFNIKISQ